MTIRIGTSGFIYEHWRNRFYPPSARGSELELYARTFDTVELNVTFYRMPPSSTFRSWATRVPADFVFAVKASRYLTHVRRLKQPRDAVSLLVDRTRGLGSHLGPILIQLPPDLELDLAALEETLDAFPRQFQVAVEPRNASWFVEDVRRLLSARNAALCVADRRGPITPLWHTADWSYVRFHAGRAKPRSCYTAQELEAWAERLEAGWGRRAPGYVFFNNDGHGCALRDASVYARALAEHGVALSSLPIVGDEILLDPGRVVADAEGRAPTDLAGAWRAARRVRSSPPPRRGAATRCQPR